jgi:aminopeptidase N
MPSRRAALALAVAALVACLPGCGSGSGGSAPAPVASAALPSIATVALPTTGDEQALLDAAFRIDIDRIEVVLDAYPSEARARVQATLTFRMRSGQSRPIVHFGPAASAVGVTLRLDGEAMDLTRPTDARLLVFEGSGQTSVELLRNLTPTASHRLEVSAPLSLSDAAGRFFTDVNDILGRGNDLLFPTLNTPHELAHHVLVIRVHAAEPYLCAGSGIVTGRVAGDVQEWVLDTERPVASYTVMFHAAPARSHVLSERRLQGVDVRVLAPLGGVTAEEAFAQLEPWLAELQEKLGPFPMPRGLAVVLTQTGGGMEYYGATTTSLRALRHEVFHMYYGCSTIARTYRDSWWDEAIDMWYELSLDPAFAPIPEDYRSDIVSARSAVAVGFDRRAYDDGARILQAMAADVGGRERMVRFLGDLHRRRTFDPFTTWDLADELQAAGGRDVRERFGRWLYLAAAARGASARPGRSPYDWMHEVDLTLPEAALPAKDSAKR